MALVFRMGLDWIGNKWEGQSSTHGTDLVYLSVLWRWLISPMKLLRTPFSRRYRCTFDLQRLAAISSMPGLSHVLNFAAE